MQTFNEPPKSKHVQTDEIHKKVSPCPNEITENYIYNSINSQNVEVYASDWEREDTMKMIQTAEQLGKVQ